MYLNQYRPRLQCQTLTKQGERPCRGKGILCKNGKIRCRIHGGASTGPKSYQGKLRSLKNLKHINYEQIAANYKDVERYRNSVDEW